MKIKSMGGAAAGGYRFADVKPLIVDDSSHIRTLLKDVLLAFGSNVVLEASDGVDAIQAVQDNKVDLIFTNWMMAPMDGLDFIRRMRTPNSSPDPYVPIIVLSAHATIDQIKKCRDAGAHAFLAKPFTPASIAKILTTIIENPRPFVKTKTYFGPDRRIKNFPYQGNERRGKG